MTDVIRPWIWPGIEKEIRQALEWKSGSPASCRESGKPKFEDDGSNLRIQSSEVDKRCQIIKVNNLDNIYLFLLKSETVPQL